MKLLHVKSNFIEIGFKGPAANKSALVQLVGM